MIQIIIFSFNRALQLDALLNSIIEFWKLPDYKLSIIYNTSSEQFEKGYRTLREKYPQFSFVKETRKKSYYPLKNYFSFFNWKKITKYKYCRFQNSNFRFLLNQILGLTDCENIMFLTDDSVFIKEVNLDNADLSWINKKPKQNSISLRLGINITAPPKSMCLKDKRIEWEYNKYKSYKNWGYRFSVDGHIYNLEIIRWLLSKIIYTNPSTLEGHICDYVNRKQLLNNGMTFEYPYLLSFPINMVQTIVKNESLCVSVEQLNAYFLEGCTLNYIIPNNITEFQHYPQKLILKREEEIQELVINR